MKKLLITVAASALMLSGALAHTPAPVVTVAPAFVPDTGFDWDGFYIGVGVTGASKTVVPGPSGLTLGNLDFIAGFNITSNEMLFGVEGWLGGYSFSGPPASTGIQGGLAARVGYLVTPDALIYVSGGAQYYDLALFNTVGNWFGTVGLGAEFAVADNISLDVEYKFGNWLNPPAPLNPGASFTTQSIGVSVNWGF